MFLATSLKLKIGCFKFMVSRFRIPFSGFQFSSSSYRFKFLVANAKCTSLALVSGFVYTNNTVSYKFQDFVSDIWFRVSCLWFKLEISGQNLKFTV